VKLVSDGKIKETVSRENLYSAETPQVFSVEHYANALSAAEDLHCITDDNMLLEKMSVPIVPVVLSRKNPKITYTDDLDYAEFLLKKEGRA
jgi:2-C-methyl-D-erythritol 4-phosphate cytidylyltransferase